MKHRWLIAGITFLLVGALELTFFALTVVGVITGGAMGVAGVMDGQMEAAAVGGVVFLIYGVWFFCTLFPALLHLGCGLALVAGKRPIKLVWAATIGSFLPIFTLYCAPTSVIAAAAGLVALLVKTEEDLLREAAEQA